jgi:hypothetical protein
MEVSMSAKSDLMAMTKTELRNYVLANRDDEEALQVYLDRVAAETHKSRVYSPDENVENSIAEYVNVQEKNL